MWVLFIKFLERGRDIDLGFRTGIFISIVEDIVEGEEMLFFLTWNFTHGRPGKIKMLTEKLNFSFYTLYYFSFSVYIMPV